MQVHCTIKKVTLYIWNKYNIKIVFTIKSLQSLRNTEEIINKANSQTIDIHYHHEIKKAFFFIQMMLKNLIQFCGFSRACLDDLQRDAYEKKGYSDGECRLEKRMDYGNPVYPNNLAVNSSQY